MTVGELKKLIERAPDDSMVYYMDYEFGQTDVTEVEIETDMVTLS